MLQRYVIFYLIENMLLIKMHFLRNRVIFVQWKQKKGSHNGSLFIYLGYR